VTVERAARLLRSRSLAATLSVLCVVVTAACGSSSDLPTNRPRIAFLMPDIEATRYDRFDVPLFLDKVRALCPACEVISRNAVSLHKTQVFQAEEALDAGAKVVVLDPVDGKAAAEIVRKAKAKKAAVISYDRLVENADIDYYISADNENIGRLQATALVQRLRRAGITSGRIVMINGSQTDNNALQYNKGARSVFDSTGFQTVPKPDFFTPGWQPARARDFMAQQISDLRLAKESEPTALGFVGVYAANDGVAAAAIDAMNAAGIRPLPPVTGQDAELPAIRRIVSGEQYMTIQKDYRTEAERAADIAVALLNGKRPQVTARTSEGGRQIPSVFVGAVTLTRENLESAVIDNDIYSFGEICTNDLIGACTDAGLS
jgi:D-xylose transport system substrate-binding protein